MAMQRKKISADRRMLNVHGKSRLSRAKQPAFSGDSPGPQLVTQSPADVSQWNELLKLGQRFTDKFISLLPLVLEDKEASAVRKLRIVTRRLELMLSLIYGKPSPRYARKLRARIKRSRRVLSELADCDVLLKIAQASLAQTPAEGKAAWETVIRFIQKRRMKIVPKSLAKVSRIEFSAPCSKVLRDFQENGCHPRVYSDGKLQELTPEEADELVQQRILRTLARLWRDFESIVEESRESSREQVIHGVRIATKRLRYLVEVMKNLDVPRSQYVLSHLRELQRTIGEWHDMEVLEQMTSNLLVQKKFVRNHLELAVEIEELFLRNREIKRSAEEKFRLMMPRSPDYREIKSWVQSKIPRLNTPSLSPSARPCPVSAASRTGTRK